MVVLKIIKRINFRQLFGLLGLFIRNPLYAFPTIFGTIRCMRIANAEYGNSHHASNKANAFRHAIWNVILIKKCLKWKKNVESALVWAEKFTNWHEAFSVNNPLDEAMDLHNNRIGRNFYKDCVSYSEAQTVTFIKEKATHAMKVLSLSEINNYPDTLVYIQD